MPLSTKSHAMKGDADAQFNLALRYQDGDGVERDFAKAAHWFNKAANQGHAAAQYGLALMYGKGQGMQLDETKSTYWNRKAAERGHQAAQFSLAGSYEKGVGVAPDPKLAYVWFALAGAKGTKQITTARDVTGAVSFRIALSAQKGYTVADSNRNRLALKMSQPEREAAEKLAQEFFCKYVLPFR
ncbi:MAG: sel1 repeat family protein [Gammaproteobacteria bacterium]|nr:sel1 repeat family protein [Gammaproteobacteria bacterium]